MKENLYDKECINHVAIHPTLCCLFYWNSTIISVFKIWNFIPKKKEKDQTKYFIFSPMSSLPFSQVYQLDGDPEEASLVSWCHLSQISFPPMTEVCWVVATFSPLKIANIYIFSFPLCSRMCSSVFTCKKKKKIYWVWRDILIVFSACQQGIALHMCL